MYNINLNNPADVYYYGFNRGDVDFLKTMGLSVSFDPWGLVYIFYQDDNDVARVDGTLMLIEDIRTILSYALSFNHLESVSLDDNELRETDTAYLKKYNYTVYRDKENGTLVLFMGLTLVDIINDYEEIGMTLEEYRLGRM